MMISTKEQLKNCLAIEKEFYVPISSLGRNIRNILLGGPDVEYKNAPQVGILL